MFGRYYGTCRTCGMMRWRTDGGATKKLPWGIWEHRAVTGQLDLVRDGKASYVELANAIHRFFPRPYLRRWNRDKEHWKMHGEEALEKHCVQLLWTGPPTVIHQLLGCFLLLPAVSCCWKLALVGYYLVANEHLCSARKMIEHLHGDVKAQSRMLQPALSDQRRK